MKFMKNLLIAVLVLTMAMSLCACGGNTPADDAAEPTVAQTAPQTEPVKETEETPVDDGKVTYTVSVVDENGNPISGAMVQLCLDTCLPGMTDASGAAVFNVDEADYKVSFLTLPAGYTYSTEEQEFYFEEGSTEITLTLKAEG